MNTVGESKFPVAPGSGVLDSLQSRKSKPSRRLQPLHRAMAKASRWAIFAMLLSVIGASIGLSIVLETTAKAIRRNADPAIQQNIPQLRHLLNFESAVLRYQLVLDKYYTHAIDQDRFHMLESIERTELENSFDRLAPQLENSQEIDQVRDNYLKIVNRTPEVEHNLMANGVSNREAARRIIFDQNQDAKILHGLINELQERAQHSLSGSSTKVDGNISGIARLVHLFDVLALLTSGFMMYHVWARFRLEKELEYQAGHDPLTGLAHRRSFVTRLQSLSGQRYVVVLGTIDRFSRIIGGFGHAFGDKVMVGLADRIRQGAEYSGGEVFRLDGANFAILYQLERDTRSFDDAIFALREEVRNLEDYEGHEIFTTLSLGAASCPDDGTNPDLLLRNADAALQAARKAGGDTLTVYTQRLNAQAAARLDQEAQLRRAIDRDEFELHYQPQQDLRDGTLVGFEALIRWRRNGELVSPGEFIPLAEECGLIGAIGDWVLQEVCRQIQAWHAIIGSNVVVAVNISPRQFSDANFVRHLEVLLTTTGIDPGCLELEITEGVMMEEAECAIEVLHRLRKMGFKLSIDDFGTGYSSLAYLARFPINKLKIDQSFIRHMTAATEQNAIVQATIILGHNLGVTIIAEGVETASQLALLKGWKCDEIQGYFYSRPLSAEAALDFLREQRLLSV
ncbi:putative bifunctional diguanylate cyclase/phosphodiesterase [Undibacterium sp. TJN25]|uniref:putative bifunctional diguanylate cyclase/phosphodiesterase n=1 Tax=Undibacterium sp. TJN25 TaxID=3413056 RepID=UPI003BF125D0